MSKKNIKNTTASILQRLKNYSSDRHEDYGLILSRYAIERFLYRLSLSAYADQFVLKGAQLFCLWTDNPYRPTRDLDLLRFGSSDIPELESIIRNVCELKIDVPDGIAYLLETIKGQAIREDNAYDGVRIRFEYRIGSVGQFMQIDIGFGDTIIPAVDECPFPSMLGFPSAQLQTYRRETVIAEKVEAMIHLGMANSRMKDFFDICKLSEEFEFDATVLRNAIEATFVRRGTDIPAGMPVVFTSEFSENQTKRIQWQAFLKKSALDTHLLDSDFSNVIEKISALISPLFQSIRSGHPFHFKWTPTTKWVPDD